MGLLQDKVALITGAGQGLGRACAQLFAREGAKVVVADLNSETGNETVQVILTAGGDAAFIRADVSSSGDVRAMVRFAVDTFGRLDCAVNNAVLAIPYAPLAEIETGDWIRALSVNVTGAFLCMKYEIQAMLENGRGAIVNIGSGRETTGKGSLAWYLSAKQMVYGMTKCAARDYGAKGIRINAVAPGPMWTPALRETAMKMPGQVDNHISHVPMGRIGEPEEVAEAVLWLCSDRASYVLGTTLSADGGYVLT